MSKNLNTPATVDAFAGIRPAATAYADAARTEARRSATLKGHADLPLVWARFDALVEERGKARGVMLDVAREVLGLSSDVTLTREEGKPLAPAAARLEALVKWLSRNMPKPEDDAPAARVMRVTLSGEGGGTAVVPENWSGSYADLVALIAGGADA